MQSEIPLTVLSSCIFVQLWFSPAMGASQSGWTVGTGPVGQAGGWGVEDSQGDAK